MEKRNIKDEELLYEVRTGDDEALLLLMKRYQSKMAAMIAVLLNRSNCVEYQDAGQVASLGILKAIETWQPEKAASFKYFASLCAEREVRSLLRHERAKGIYTANRMMSLDTQLKEDEGAYLVDFIKNNQPEFNPKWVVRSREILTKYHQALLALTPLERKVYDLWQAEKTYKAIAQQLAITPKKVDSTIQKVKKRLRNCVD